MRILTLSEDRAVSDDLARIYAGAGHENIISCSQLDLARELCELHLPDLLVLGLSAARPHMEVLHGLHPWIVNQGYLPVLVLMDANEALLREEALRSGAREFMSRPLDPIEFIQRSQNLLEARLMHNQLAKANSGLEARVRERTRQLEEVQVEIVNRLGIATNLRDDQTGHHILRVGTTCEAIALELGIDADEAALIGLAARLHDVGKIGVPDEILLKPGALTDFEMTLMRRHTLIGGELLEAANAPVLVIAHTIALSHHEKWDGTGYPYGLAGDEIPLAGRICAVADVYDSLCHDRPYKNAWPEETAIAEIKRCSGSHFDPVIVDAFLNCCSVRIPSAA
jgi:putative two-component system response regulator